MEEELMELRRQVQDLQQALEMIPLESLATGDIPRYIVGGGNSLTSGIYTISGIKGTASDPGNVSGTPPYDDSYPDGQGWAYLESNPSVKVYIKNRYRNALIADYHRVILKDRFVNGGTVTWSVILIG